MSANIEMIQRIAQGLGNLKEKVVFVGGSVAEIYADYPEVSDIRPTMDVDCVVDIQINTYLDYSKLEDKLRSLGFKNDTTPGAPICRKMYQGIIVDFMPVNPAILGFSNQWYGDGMENKNQTVLPDGNFIYIFPVEYYVATKFEALNSRGGNDIRGSHDWEDIVFIMNNRAALSDAIRHNNNPQLVEYLQEQFRILLQNNNIREIVYTSLPYHSEEENIDMIIQIMHEIITNNEQIKF
ncbi:MAG: hypothetical protein EZS26_002016 [Candidatus Ordinivivax streblomastigis]|uniref:Uncharacterized protein n=1 Tax=Candidatus Ordinivivax streblomastigis TaxID=2540710 RepID=A0A5M8P0A5_9BACT|nr:MAG: hypothetical protein EZS26_002016 [Candidatus Ordinivivax streblomastigis]